MRLELDGGFAGVGVGLHHLVVAQRWQDECQRRATKRSDQAGEQVYHTGTIESRSVIRQQAPIDC
jgi:hypothetical protein